MFDLWSCVACRDPSDCLSPVCCCRDPRDCLSLVLKWSLPLLHLKDFQSGMVSDGFQTERRGSWIPGKERAERVLASAVSIDGRNEWTCKFCSESNVWTRWRCRRCYHDIPAVLRGKYTQAVAARNGRLRVERSWMSKRGSFSRSCERLKKLSCVPKEFQENLESDLQQQLQEVEQRRRVLMPEHQKGQKRSQRIPSLRK